MQDDTKNTNLDLLSIGDASEYLGISIDTLRRWEARGRIVPLRSPGGHRYFNKKDLEDLFGKRYTRDEETLRAKGSPEPETIKTTAEELSRIINPNLPNLSDDPSASDLKQTTNLPAQTGNQHLAAPIGLPSWRTIKEESNSSFTSLIAPITQTDRPSREVKIPEAPVIRIVSQSLESSTKSTSILSPSPFPQLTTHNPLPTTTVPVKLSQSTKKYIAITLLFIAFILGSIAWYSLWQKSQLILSPIP